MDKEDWANEGRISGNDGRLGTRREREKWIITDKLATADRNINRYKRNEGALAEKYFIAADGVNDVSNYDVYVFCEVKQKRRKKTKRIERYSAVSCAACH